jgi:hypothetical protein
MQNFITTGGHLAMDKVVLNSGAGLVRKYIAMKRKRFSIRIYKLCDKSGHMCDMRVYLG